MSRITTRGHVAVTKSVESDTGWRMDAMQPRYGPYPKTRIPRRYWQWRSFTLQSESGVLYKVLIEAAPALCKWKAWLMNEAGTKIILRLEDQIGGQPGRHVHAFCDESSPKGLEFLAEMKRIPAHGSWHRRQQAWSLASFCHMSLSTFRVQSHSEQEEMSLDGS